MLIVRIAVGALVAAVVAPNAVAQSNVRPVARVTAPIALGTVHSGPRHRVDPLAAHARLAAEEPLAVARQVVELDFTGRMQPGADIAGGGDLATQRGGWTATIAREVGEERTLAVALKSEATFFDFGGAGVAGLVDPFNDLYRTALGATLYTPWNDTVSLFGGAEFTLAGEDTSDLDSSLIVAASSGITYRASPELELALGISASQRLEADAWVIPFLGVDWRMADDWRLRLEGERVHLEWQARRDLSFAVHAAYEQRQYRLNDSNPLPGGVFRDEQIDVGAALTWRPTAGVELRAGAGYTVWREFTLLDANGVGVEAELANAPFGELALRFSF